jgi:hypothetical protein
MHVLERTYDFGSMLPPGITVISAVKYLLSINLGLPPPREETFEKQYEKWYHTTLSEAFIEALEHLSVYPSYEATILSCISGTYDDETNGNVPKIYSEAVRTVATKIASSKPKTYTTESIYNAFIAVNILTNLLRAGKSDCKEYLGLLPFEVIEVYGVTKARSEFPDAEVVYGIYKRGGLDSLILQVLEYPRQATALVRKRYFRTYVATLEKIRKQSIFTIFFEKVAKDHGRKASTWSQEPEAPRSQSEQGDHGTSLESALNQLARLSEPEQKELMERVSDLHDMGIIDTKVTLTIPSEKEIDSVENYVINTSVSPKVTISESSINIAKTILNYRRNIDVLHVDDIKFPSIAHYAYYCLSRKRYSAIVARGSFIATEISDPYHFLPPLEDYFYRVAHMNELEGVGRKLTEDLVTPLSAPLSQVDEPINNNTFLFVDKKLYELVELSTEILKETKKWISTTSTILLGGVVWAYKKRRYVCNEMARLVGIGTYELNEKTALIALSLGVCIPSSIDMEDSLDKILFETCYNLMGSVLALNPLITPEKVIDYARRTSHPPRFATKLPRAIAYPAIALNYIMRVLTPLYNGDSPPSFKMVDASINVLSGRVVGNVNPLYNDYTKILSLELGIDNNDAAIINGFIAEIPHIFNNDHIYRRIVFYANPK